MRNARGRRSELRSAGRIRAAAGDGARCGEVRGELDALRLAAGERRRRLAQAHVAEADLIEHVQLVDDLRDAREVDERLLHRHVQHVVDVAALVLDVEDRGLVTRSVALFAGQLDVGEELHLDRDGAVAFAGVAAAAGHVEGEDCRR